MQNGIKEILEKMAKNTHPVTESAFKDELQKISSEEGLKKLVKGIIKKHPNLLKEIRK